MPGEAKERKGSRESLLRKKIVARKGRKAQFRQGKVEGKRGKKKKPVRKLSQQEEKKLLLWPRGEAHCSSSAMRSRGNRGGTEGERRIIERCEEKKGRLNSTQEETLPPKGETTGEGRPGGGEGKMLRL